MILLSAVLTSGLPRCLGGVAYVVQSPCWRELFSNYVGNAFVGERLAITRLGILLSELSMATLLLLQLVPL